MIQSIKGRKTRKRKRGGWRKERERMIGVGQSKYRKGCPSFSFLSPYTQEIPHVQEKMGASVLVRRMNPETVIQSEVS